MDRYVQRHGGGQAEKVGNRLSSIRESLEPAEKDTIANIQFIESENYRMAFDKLFKQSKLNSEVCRQTRKAIRINSGQKTENYAFVFSDGSKTVTGKTGMFGGSVDISVLKGKADASVVLTHNHPLSSSFSADDIDLLLQLPQINFIIAGGHDGTVYKLSIGTGRRTVDNNLYAEYNIIKDSGASPHEIVEKMAQKYGWRYERVEAK